MKKLGLGLALLAVAGCTHTGTEHEHSLWRGVVPVTETDREARSMCSAVSYEEDHDRWLSFATSLRQDVLSSYRAPAADGEYGHADGINDALYMISQFEAELDGSYDALVQNCRAYNQCMIRNNYQEGDCTQSAGMWTASQERYHQLAYDIAAVRERVADTCKRCTPPPPNRPPPPPPPASPAEPAQSAPKSSSYGPFDAGSR